MSITVTRTYLQLSAPSDLSRDGVSSPGAVEVTQRIPVAPALFRELYEQVGGAYRWRDRDVWTDDEIVERFAGDRVSLWELTLGGARAGFYELERHDDGSVEIVLFGLLPPFAGRGLGRWLLVDAVDRAWSLEASRVWLHTCTLDSAAALPNYLSRGFKPFRTEQYQVAG
jgi:GNAT superfamily N-acetyltransferase